MESDLELDSGRVLELEQSDHVLTISWAALTVPRTLFEVAQAVLGHEQLSALDDQDVAITVRCVGESWDSSFELCANQARSISVDRLWDLAAGGARQLPGWRSTVIHTPCARVFASATEEFGDARSQVTASASHLYRLLADRGVLYWALGEGATFDDVMKLGTAVKDRAASIHPHANRATLERRVQRLQAELSEVARQLAPSHSYVDDLRGGLRDTGVFPPEAASDLSIGSGGR